MENAKEGNDGPQKSLTGLYPPGIPAASWQLLKFETQIGSEGKEQGAERSQEANL